MAKLIPLALYELLLMNLISSHLYSLLTILISLILRVKGECLLVVCMCLICVLLLLFLL